MQDRGSLDWWPERQLRVRPISQVWVCEGRHSPPLCSQIAHFPRLEVPLAGCYESRFVMGGRTFTARIRPGAALLAAPYCWELPTWRCNVQVMSLLFAGQRLAVSVITGRGPEAPPIAVRRFSVPWPRTGPLPHLLNGLLELQSTCGSPEALADVTRALLRCIGELGYRRQPGRTGHGQGLLDSVCLYLQNHYEYDVTREAVARHFKVSPNYLSRLFQLHGNMSFGDYLTQVRLELAKRLLGNLDLKLDEIATQCGYRDTPYFCRVFRRVAKTTPAEYRLSVRNKQVALGE